MKQPLGFMDRGQENLVCSLDCAIYGLHQSEWMWYFELDSILVNLGFEKFQYVTCAYLLNMLNQHLDLKVLGKTQKLLGVSFEYINNSVLIYQKLNTNEVYDSLSNFHIPSFLIPIVKKLKYSKLNCPSDYKSETEMS